LHRKPTNADRQVQPFDNQKDCLALDAEISGNSQPIIQLADEKADKRVQNIVAGTVGLVLFWPALFAMDFQDAGSLKVSSYRENRWCIRLACADCWLYCPRKQTAGYPDSREQSRSLMPTHAEQRRFCGRE